MNGGISMTKREIFLQQLRAVHDQNTWFVSMEGALDGLTEEQVGRKTEGQTNSIWGIINHLAFYNQRYLNRFNGRSNPNIEETNNNTFANRNNLDWSSTVK